MADLAAPQQDQGESSLHDLAVGAASSIQQLATGLAHAGANPAAIQQLTLMSNRLTEITRVLAQGPIGQATPSGAQQHSPAVPPDQQPPPQHVAQPAPSQGPPPEGSGPAAAAMPNPTTLGHAVHALHQSMQQAAAQRRTASG